MAHEDIQNADVGNPIDLSCVRKKRTRINFPAALPKDARQRTIRLIRNALCFSVFSFLSSQFLGPDWIADDVMKTLVITAILYVILVKPNKTILPMVQLFVLALIWTFVSLALSPILAFFETLLVFSALLLFLVAVRFARHYRVICRARIYRGIKVRRRFLIFAFFDAVTCWFCYPQLGYPGLQRSPVGGPSWRMFQTTSVFLLLQFVIRPLPLYFLDNSRAYSQDYTEALPYFALFFAAFLAPISIMLLACFVVSLPTGLGRSYALRLANESGEGELFAKAFSKLQAESTRGI